MKRTSALLLGVLLFCMGFPSFALAQGETTEPPPLTPVAQLVDADGNVVFNDKVIETAIRDTLGLSEGPITPAQLSKLGAKQEQLNIESPNPITADFSVLQLCPKLKMLYLDQVTPINLNAISAAKSLTYFGAHDVKFTDLSFLVGIKGLCDLWISECPCTDISAVVNMPNLVNFSIDTYVADISPLYVCKKLTSVSIAKLTDAQVNILLEKLGARLIGLGLNACPITDETLERISSIKLSSLMLDAAPVRSIAPVWNIKTLQSVQLFNLQIDSLDGIQNLKRLRNVCLRGITGLQDYSPLFQQTALRILTIANSGILSLQGIQNLKSLEELNLETLNSTIDLTPVFVLTKLKQLSLYDVKVTTISGMEGLTALTDLSLYRVHGIEDYSPLTGLKKLRAVNTDTPEKIPAGLPVS